MNTRLPLSRALAVAALLAVLVLAVAAVGLGRWFGPPPSRTGSASEPAEALAQALDRALHRGTGRQSPGLAIRPLATDPAQRDAAGLALAVCDALARGLGQLPDLRVASCASTGIATAAALDNPRLGRLLDVGYLLDGRLDTLPDQRVQVRLALHDVKLGTTRWQIDEILPLSGLQALPLRVAQQTGQVVGQVAQPSSEPPLDADSYTRFLQASQLARRPADANRLQALQLAEQVLAAAPDHLPAQYLRLGLMSTLSTRAAGPAATGSARQIETSQAELQAQILELGQRMVAQDPTNWRGNILLLNAAFGERRWADALDRADALWRTRRHPGMLRIAANVYLAAGYVEQARSLLEDAARIDALDPSILGLLATTHGMRGDTAAMAELLTIAQQLGHRQLELPLAMQALRRADASTFERQALAWAGDVENPAPWASAWVRGVLEPAARPAAEQALQQAEAPVKAQRAHFLLEYALLGNTPRSLQALTALAQQPLAQWVDHLWWPEMAGVRSQPGFGQAMAEQGLTALWRVRGAPDLCSQDGAGTWTCR